jgi:uncharacterized membrane protein YkoI
MGSIPKFLAAGVAVGLLVGGGVGFLAGNDRDEFPQSPSLDAQAEMTAGADAVLPEPARAGNADDGGQRGDSRSGGWRTNEVRINQDEAEAVAASRIGDARVLHAEIDEEDGYYLWEVLLQRANGSFVEVFVDAGDGVVVGVDHEGFDD